MITVWLRPGPAGMALAGRALRARYRGSLLGGAWALVGPVVMLLVYVFVLTEVFGARWGGAAEVENAKGVFGLAVFSGLLVHNFVAECVVRAPEAVREHAALVKRGGLGVPTIGWAIALTAGVQLLIGLVVYGVGFVLVMGRVPGLSLLWAVVVLGSVLAGGLGLSWGLAAAGAYIRDLREASVVAVTLMLFASPVFYSSAMLEGREGWGAELVRFGLAANPVGWWIEGLRDAVLEGRAPAWDRLGLGILAGAGLAVLGGLLASRASRGLGDEV